MKKLYLLLSFGIFTLSTQAQDTLLWENFNDTIIGQTVDDLINDAPSGLTDDPLWYSYDEDQLGDGSGASRPGDWFLFSGGFAAVDSLDVCAGSNSWTNDASTPVRNWLVLPTIQITDGASAVLKWKSAPRQTPYYLDGYQVLISATTNDVTAFTDVVFDAGQYISGPYNAGTNCCNGGDYSLYTFSAGMIHGDDGTFVQFTDEGDDMPGDSTAGDSARFIGVQKEFSVPLTAYDNQKIYIAFLHNSTDDNLLSLDDILVTENSDITFGVEGENSFAGSVYPNPANAFVNVSFDFLQYHNVKVELVDNQGHVLYSTLATANMQINTEQVASGVYFVKVTADEGSMVKKVVITH